MGIEVRNITKCFGPFKALNDVSLKVPTGELVALLGPSGSGKTTLLRIIAGLEVPDPGSGPILFSDENIAQQKVGDRKIGFVFQHYALFRHMSVFENIAFGLRVRPKETRPGNQDIRDRVNRLLKLVQLEGMARRLPSQLSGGQRQRVALARALAVEPKILLLDEPFGALDAKVRQELRRWLRRLHEEIHLTSVFVTHDQEEAIEVADRLVIMSQGRIEQIGTPEEVFHNPASAFVMNFLGNVNIFHGQLRGGKAVFGSLTVNYPDGDDSAEGPVKVFIRPHDLDIVSAPGDQGAIRALVERVNSASSQVKIDLVCETGDQVLVEIPHEYYRALNIEKGSAIFIRPKDIKLFFSESQTY